MATGFKEISSQKRKIDRVLAVGLSLLALAVYALRGKKGGFWLSLAALAPFALPFLWDRYVGILPQLLFAVCAAAVLLSAIRAGLFQVKKNCARALVWALLVLAVVGIFYQDAQRYQNFSD